MDNRPVVRPGSDNPKVPGLCPVCPDFVRVSGGYWAKPEMSKCIYLASSKRGHRFVRKEFKIFLDTFLFKWRKRIKSEYLRNRQNFRK